VVGFTVELLRAAAAVGGFEVELVPGWWSVNRPAFQAGQLDVLSQIAQYEAPLYAHRLSVVQASLQGVLYTRPEAPRLRRAADLRDRRIGVLQGTVAATHLRENPQWGIRVELFAQLDDLLNAVLQGRCDGALFTSNISRKIEARAGLRKQFIEDIRYYFCFAFQPQDNAGLMRMNEALAELRQNGTYDRLFHEWVGPVEPRRLNWFELRPYVLGSLPVLVFLVVLALRQHVQRRLIAQRMAVARDLHDELGNRLNEMQLLTELAVLKPAAAGADVLGRVRARLIEASLSLNQLLWELRPESESWGSAVAGLERIARRYLEAAGIAGEFVNRVSPSLAGKAAPPEIRRAVMMAQRELLRNAVNHGKPGRIDVTVEVSPERVEVVIADTGPGVDPARALGEKRGLYHLQQRVAELGGTLELARGPAGFTARAEFPAGR
jgi:signal transduction histidine kinase